MDNYEVEYTKHCIEAVQNGKATYRGGREYISYKGKTIAASRALWNFWHPNDPLKETDVVHHKDGDKTNNSIENLVKMSAGEHMALHRKNPVRGRQPEKRVEYYRSKVVKKQEEQIRLQEEQIKMKDAQIQELSNEMEDLEKKLYFYKNLEHIKPYLDVSSIWLAKENAILKRLIKNNMDPLSLRNLIKEAECIVKEEFKTLILE